MKITLQVVEDVCILRLEGKFIVGGESFYLREKVKEILAMGCKNVLVDLTKVPYIDSTGIGFLVSSHTTVTHEGGAFKLINPNAKVREVLNITRLAKIFEIFDDEEAALKSFSTAAPAKKKAGATKKKKAEVADPET